MTSPLENAGATREPSEYATISMDRAITGLWTQRSPLRDADVPYLYGKFYAASRFDSLIDGLNREITAKLSYARRCGTSVYNSNTFPAINSFYPYKRIVNGQELITLIADGMDGVIYNATAGQKSTIFTKAGSAGKARFQGVNQALYFADGAENKKWLQPPGWTAQTSLATTQYEVGTIIIDSNGHLEYLTTARVGTITNVQITANTVLLTFSPTNFAVTVGMRIQTSLGTATFLNATAMIVQSISPSGGNFIVTTTFVHAPYASAADTGFAFSADVGTPATTGGSQPVWGVTSTTDGTSVWGNYGAPVFDWGPPAAPSTPPSLSQLFVSGLTLAYWQALINYPIPPYLTNVTIMDTAGYLWCGGGGIFQTGPNYPNFPAPLISGGVVKLQSVVDNAITWFQAMWFGTTNAFIATGPTGWQPTFTPINASVLQGDVLVDSNGNVQRCIATGGTGKSGGAVPTWNTAFNGNTTDGGLTWANLGPWLNLSFAGWQYAYAWHCVDGSVSTLSPLTPSTKGVMAGTVLTGSGNGDPQVDSIWIFRTASGTGTPLYLAQIANPGAGLNWTFTDQNVDANLDFFSIGPQADANDPPPLGITAPIYHLGRIWAIYNNLIIASGGPDTLVGNGNTAFPPANVFPIPEQAIRLFSGVTQAGPAVFVWAATNIYVILGDGSSANPFRKPVIYMGNVGITSYDAVCTVGSTAYAFTGKGKAISLDPGAGAAEYGFPIGDQLRSVTTGLGGQVRTLTMPTGALYSPGSTFVTWAELDGTDTGVYICDGSVGWFRYSPVASPESGFLWSPRAVLMCGSSAVQSIETVPGNSQLLIGPVAGGTGTCTVGGASNTTLNWTSGPKFNFGWAGLAIIVGGVAKTVASVQGPNSLTINTAATPGAGISFVVTAGGPILFRDSSVRRDWVNGSYQAYPSYDVKGNIVLCQSGEVAEIAHIALKSLAIGSRPVVGLLIGEIAETGTVPFDWIDRTSSDPPDLPDSTTLYSDRYSTLQNGVCPKCDHFQLAIDYGTQDQADELLTFSVYGAKHAERKQQ